MIILKLTAYDSTDLNEKNTGLGNVLYQICFLYSISKKYNIISNYSLLEKYLKKLELFGLNNYRNTIFRNFYLKDENIKVDFILKEETFIYDKNLIKKILNNKDKNILIKNSYLQSFLYFNKYEKEIQEIFSPNQISISYINNKYPNLFNNKFINISIHLRLEWGGNLTYDYIYFKNAIKYINQNININDKKIIYYVFSDNCNKAKKILKNIKKISFIFCKQNMDYIDMWTMSLCQHNIICHSTLGWWGAYLNTNKNKYVIYPSDYLTFFCKKILKKNNLIEIHKNIYPKEWICLTSSSMKK